MSQFIAPIKLEQVQGLLHQRLGGQVRDLRVVVREAQVVLQGIAVSFYAKQVAQHLIFDALGTIALVNEIEVRRLVRQRGLDDDRTG